MPFSFQLRRYSSLLLRRFGLLGHVGTTLIEDVQPVLNIDQERPELYALRDELLFVISFTQPAVVAQLSACFVGVPSDGSRLLVLPLIHVSLSAAGAVRFGIAAAGPGGMLPFQPADTRLPVQGALGGISSAAASIITSTFGMEDLPAAQSIVIDLPVVLSPGFRFVVESMAVNVQLRVGFRWYEWNPAPQERAIG